jgi:hypothetical protein
MILSERLGLVFIHVPKTAGSSLSTALMERDPKAVRTLDGLPRTKHVTALQLRDVYAQFDQLFSFAVVRDPFSRFCSLYRYLHTLPKYAHSMRNVSSLEAFAELFNAPSWVDTLHSSKPQSEFVTDQTGALMVSAIFRYESLDQAVSTISSRLGGRLRLPQKKVTKVGSRGSLGGWLRGLSRQSAPKAKPDFRSPSVEQMLQTRYRRDYDLFGYG